MVRINQSINQTCVKMSMAYIIQKLIQELETFLVSTANLY